MISESIAILPPAVLLPGVPDIVEQLLLSAVMLAAAVLVVVGVFSQTGEVKLSPQRAAAIATGHSDRRTLFEHMLLGPLLWLLLRTSHSMALPRLKGWVRLKLTATGNPNYYTPEEYVALSFLAGLAAAAAAEAICLIVQLQFAIGWPLVALVVGVGLSYLQLHLSAANRLRAIARELPYGLDLISLAMGAGATFAEALGTIVRENPTSPLNVEFKTVLAELDLGATRRASLENLADRVPLDSMRSMVASVIQAEELGTPLGRVLEDQATLMRLNRSVRAEELAARAGVRILVPSLLLVAAVILLIFGPLILNFVVQGALF